MSRSVALVLLAMLAAGYPTLAAPIRGDEALFVSMGRQLAGGAVLYRDLWDVTNPGLIWFYQLAGTLFGFDDECGRWLEWLYQTAFVCAVCEASRRAHRLSRWPLAPALFLGVVYFYAGVNGSGRLAKTEGLIGFPLFGAVWAAATACRSDRPARWLLLAGVCGGLAVVFKLLFVGVLVAVWGYLGGVHFRRRPVTFAGCLTGGFLLGVAPAVGYFAAHGALGELWETLVVRPRQFLAEGQPASFSRLAESVRWFVGNFSVPLAAAVLAGAVRWRTARDPVVPAAAVWLVAAVGVVLAQRLSWWPHHLIAVGTPAAALAGYCWPTVSAVVGPRTRDERAVGALAAACLLIPLLAAGGYGVLALAKHRFGLTYADRWAARADIGDHYHTAEAEAAWLRSAKPGPVLVCGDPFIPLFAGRPLCTRVNGWSLELYPTPVRAEFEAEVRRARPVYVLIGVEYAPALLRERYAGLMEMLATEYAPVRTTAAGTWYERR